ncbi:hypothetical protein M758_UG201400 [Ceratodon purpureus]|nr:hypothetical protein M758_UG201400 [Ceratodon purpureus]
MVPRPLSSLCFCATSQCHGSLCLFVNLIISGRSINKRVLNPQNMLHPASGSGGVMPRIEEHNPTLLSTPSWKAWQKLLRALQETGAFSRLLFYSKHDGN